MFLSSFVLGVPSLLLSDLIYVCPFFAHNLTLFFLLLLFSCGLLLLLLLASERRRKRPRRAAAFLYVCDSLQPPFFSSE